MLSQGHPQRPQSTEDGPRCGEPLELPPWPPEVAEIGAAVSAALRSGDWRRYRGAHRQLLADALRVAVGVEHVQLCCSGSFAVELALRAAQVGSGDEVLVAAYDYPGNYRAIEAVGARPRLIDLAPGRWVIDPQAVSVVESPRVRAVVVSHLHGTMVDMASLRATCDARRWMLIEDACQVPGASVAGRPAGAWGDASVFSFGGSKLLTAGNGGALLTDNRRIAQRARVFTERPSDAFALSEIQAALLLPQLERLARWHRRRRRAAALLAAEFAASDVCAGAPASPLDGDAAYYKLGLWAASAEDRTRLVTAAQTLGLPVGSGFRGLGRRPPRRYAAEGTLEHARRAGERTLVVDHRLLMLDPSAFPAVVRRLAERRASEPESS